MQTQLVILVIIALAGIASAELSCACSDLKVEAECTNFDYGACKWADSACSEVACADRTALQCRGHRVTQTNNCVSFDSKCQATAATCAEYKSDTEILFCPDATEGYCESNFDKKSKECKKFEVPVVTACKDRSTYCFGDCYYHYYEQKCNDMPKDCSGPVINACDFVMGCLWKDAKCQATTCALQTSKDCNSYLKTDGTLQFCGVVNGACVELDPSTFPIERCYFLSQGTYRFDGSCKSCYVEPIIDNTNSTNSINSTDSSNSTESTNSTNANGITLVNSMTVVLMAIVPILMN